MDFELLLPTFVTKLMLHKNSLLKKRGGLRIGPGKISQCAYCSAKHGKGKKLLCNAGEVLGDTLIGLHILGGVLTECLHGKLLTSGKSA